MQNETGPATTWQQAITVELERLNTLLKQTTTAAYVQHKLLGQPYDTDAFWSRGDTCSRSTWNKWKKHDPVFTDVLDKAWAIARSYRADEAAAAITEAVHLLQINAPHMAGRIIALANRNDATHQDAAVALRAAVAALDRASSLTADKGNTPVTITGLDDAIERIFGLREKEPADEVADDDDP